MAIGKSVNLSKKYQDKFKTAVGNVSSQPTLKGTISDLIKDMQLKQQKTDTSFDYDEAIDALAKDLYNGKEFTYDVDSDPEWQAEKKAYTAEADKTMRDVLAQGAARTGGIASTSAITAASEARDYTMSGLEQRKAQLRTEAYNRYQQENAAKLQILSVLDDLQDEKRNEYLSLLETMENMEKSEQEDLRNEVSSMLTMGILPSEDMLTRAGYGQEYAEGIRKSYFDSMDTASMQQYLNEQGAKLSVDGSWGPATEAAYKKFFGKSSGRQTSYSSNKTPKYTPPADKKTADKRTADKTTNAFQTGNKAIDKAQYDGLIRTIKTYISQGKTAKAKKILEDNVELLSEEQYKNLIGSLGLE